MRHEEFLRTAGCAGSVLNQIKKTQTLVNRDAFTLLKFIRNEAPLGIRAEPVSSRFQSQHSMARFARGKEF
jgi:hypothetical protein